MNWTTEMNALLAELGEVYSTQSDIKRLSRQVNIRTAFITWEGKVMNDWFNVIEEASKQEKLLPMLNFIREESLANPPLVEAAIRSLGASDPVAVRPISSIISFEPKPEDFIPQIKEFIGADKLEEGIRILRGITASISNDSENTVINFSAQLASLKRQQLGGMIDNDEGQRTRNRIRFAILGFLDDLPNEIRLNKRLDELPGAEGRKPEIIQLLPQTILTPAQGVEEKIIGNRNEMLPTPWLGKALNAARSVCRVLVGNRAEGSGFLLEGGYLLTNSHVLPNEARIRLASIEFNYEEGQSGKSATYTLDPTSVRRSPEALLDYCIVKVVNNPQKPLSHWGFLELETQTEVREGDAANMIQHPWGNLKQIAFRDNQVLSIWGDSIFYTTDSEHGSSGSPVFNDDWKVIALHRKGFNEADGGMVINANGDKKAANMGTSILSIIADPESKFIS